MALTRISTLVLTKGRVFVHLYLVLFLFNETSDDILISFSSKNLLRSEVYLVRLLMEGFTIGDSVCTFLCKIFKDLCSKFQEVMNFINLCSKLNIQSLFGWLQVTVNRKSKNRNEKSDYNSGKVYYVLRRLVSNVKV